MDPVFVKTRELAEAIMQSEAYVQMHEAEEKAMKNTEASALMGDYMEAKADMEALLEQGEPDPAQLKSLSGHMDACQERLQMIDEIMALTQAREDFGTLIGQVNQLLRFIVTGQMDAAGCGGSCASCGQHCVH